MSHIPQMVPIAELGTWTAAAFLLFFDLEYTFAEAVSYSMITTLMAFSFIYQIAFITGIPHAALALELLVSLGALFLIIKHRGLFNKAFQVIRFMVSRNPLISVCLILVLGFMTWRSIAIAPGPENAELLETITSVGQGGSFFSVDSGDSGQALLPVNASILSHMFLRMGGSQGTSMIGFIAFLSIGFSTYALCRRYSWPPTAFMVTLAVISMPRLVFHAATPGHELLPAAVVLFCILGIYRCLEQPDFIDLVLLLMGIFFAISGSVLCLAFPAILLGLSCVLFFRRHGKTVWIDLVAKKWKICLPCLLPMIVFSQVWLFSHNAIHHGGWLGPGDIQHFPMNTNVLIGGLGNLARYFFESIHPTFAVDQFLRWVVGISPREKAQGISGILYSASLAPYQNRKTNPGADQHRVVSLLVHCRRAVSFFMGCFGGMNQCESLQYFL